MRWSKQGVIFCPDRESDWMVSHAANPIAEPLGGTRVRIYFTCRDAQNRSSITYLETDLRRPREILMVHDRPLLAPGTAGSFDDSGAAMGCVVEADGRRFVYYLGWNLGVTVPWRNSIGLATGPSAQSPALAKVSPAPILDRDRVDPFSISYPWVMRDRGRWRMWYGSNLGWGRDQREMRHVIKYAESDDGAAWRRDGSVHIPLSAPDEYAIAKPCVLLDDGTYRMWYSHRGSSYRIGYAESPDGVQWTRKDDEAGIDVSDAGWDSDMIEYAHVFNVGAERYMLYNGNGFGRSGMGLAVLDQ